MFQFSAFAYYTTSLPLVRLSHSEIFESNRICQSSKLIAAYHVLHRLWEPRHPPCALIYFLLIHIPLLLGMGRFHLLSSIFIAEHVRLKDALLFLLCLLSFNMSKNSLFQAVGFKLIALGLLLNSWRISESNRWPPACKAGALASWANSPISFS